MASLATLWCGVEGPCTEFIGDCWEEGLIQFRCCAVVHFCWMIAVTLLVLGAFSKTDEQQTVVFFRGHVQHFPGIRICRNTGPFAVLGYRH
jgi:hypothetical protein